MQVQIRVCHCVCVNAQKNSDTIEIKVIYLQ